MKKNEIVCLNDKCKNIYNTYLRVSRVVKDKKFKYRKNFDNIEDNIKYSIKKLELFFNRFPNIDIEMYFLAPYEIWGKDGYYDLDFYLKRRSLVVYNQYKAQKIKDDPDSEASLKKIVESFKFIATFCNENNILVNDYIKYRIKNTYAYVYHLKNQNVSIYSLYAFDEFKVHFKNEVESDIKKLFFGEYYKDTEFFWRKWYISKKAKNISKKGLKYLINKDNINK